MANFNEEDIIKLKMCKSVDDVRKMLECKNIRLDDGKLNLLYRNIQNGTLGNAANQDALQMDCCSNEMCLQTRCTNEHL